MKLDTSRLEFDVLEERNRTVLLAYCLKIVPPNFEGEDILQEALLKAWKGFGSYKKEGSFRAWVSRIALNVARDYFRLSHERLFSVSFDQISLPIIDERTSLEVAFLSEAETDTLLDQAQKVLTPRQFALLKAITIQEFSYKEAACFFGIPLGSVRSILNRIRQKCKEKFSQNEYR